MSTRLFALPRLFYIGVIAFLCALLTACPSILPYTGQFYFSGRIAVSVSADPNIPNSKADSWSANFELSGSPQEGSLRLATPVGTTVAHVEWSADHAMVQTNEETLMFANLDELTRSYFNQNIPIAALFDWLAGKPTQQDVPGWEVDLKRASNHIIKAEKNAANAPKIKLRAVVHVYEENNNPA